MKFKSILKFGLPILAVSALAVTLPVALTSCSNNDKSNEESHTVSTSTQDINNASTELGKLTTETLGGKKEAVKDQNVFDTLTSTLKIKKDEISHINYVKEGTSPSAHALTFANEPKIEQKSTWNIEVTLKDNYNWNADILAKAKEVKNTNFEINGQTLIIKNVQTKFSTIGIDLTKLSSNAEAISKALNEVKDLANYASTTKTGTVDTYTAPEKEFIQNLVENIPSIPLSALQACLKPTTTTPAPTTPTQSSKDEGKDGAEKTPEKVIASGKEANGGKEKTPTPSTGKTDITTPSKEKGDKGKEVLPSKPDSEKSKDPKVNPNGKEESKDSKSSPKIVVNTQTTETQVKNDLDLIKSKVDATISSTSDFVIYKSGANNQSNESYKQTIEYSYVNVDSLATKITDFIKTQDVKLSSSGKTKDLVVKDGQKTINLPVQYDVLNPFTTPSPLANNGTYIAKFSFDFSKFGFEDTKLASQITSNLQSIFGSQIKYEVGTPVSIKFNEKTNKLEVQVVIDVFAVTKENLINGVNFLKRFSKDTLSNLDGQSNGLKVEIRNGLLDSIGMSELVSPLVNYMSVHSSNSSNVTTVTITFGKSQKNNPVSGAIMPVLSKELIKELKDNSTLGQENVDSITYTPATTGTKSTEATLTFKIKDQGLVTANKNVVNVTDEKINDLATWFSNVNDDSFNFNEFSQVKQNVLANGQISGIALRNSEIMNIVSQKLGITKENIFEVRFAVNPQKGKQGYSNELDVYVILNSGLSFGNPGNVSGIKIPATAKVNVTATKGNTYGVPSSNSSTSLIFKLTPKTSK